MSNERIRRFLYWWQDNWIGMLAIGGLIAAATLIVVGVSVTSSDRYQHPIYESWSRLHPQSDISFEDWKQLKSAGLLNSEK